MRERAGENRSGRENVRKATGLPEKEGKWKKQGWKEESRKQIERRMERDESKRRKLWIDDGETWQHGCLSQTMLAINATLIYHALTYDVDGSRTSQDKTNRRNWRWQAVSCRCNAPLVYAARYSTPGTNKTWLINKCINIAVRPTICSPTSLFYVYVAWTLLSHRQTASVFRIYRIREISKEKNAIPNWNFAIISTTA